MLDDTSHAWLTALATGNQAEADRLAAVLDTADHLDRARRAQVDLGVAALDYAAAGIPVFPIQPRGKKPLTRHGFKDATVDPDTITAWWGQWPDANLGTPTGITFDVVDIDGPEGIRTMYNGHRPIIDTLIVIAAARTSRAAGRHLYVPVSGRGNKAAVYPGVDYRGDGGYVVIPPSVGANGTRYQWAGTPIHVAAAAA